MAEAILVTRDLTKQFQGEYAVNRVSMTVNRGDIYGFIGINGAGKTTFMRMLCGLVRPMEGSIELFGETEKLQHARKKLGALIEHPAIYTNMSAMENLEIQRRYLNIDFGEDSKKKMEELLQLVGLENVGKKKTGKFSLGMKQRLGLALALIGNPECIILDEPSIGLDPIGVVELREFLVKLNRERNLTIFFSSHNLSEMSRLATRYGFLHRGKLVKELTAQELERECNGADLESYFVDLIAICNTREGR